MKGYTKQDVKVILLGILAIVMITMVYDWQDTVQGFQDGFSQIDNK